ncbi:MAG TPA: hypothetical protein VJT13_13085 [Xanthobacteraceae bacterium]|nr:hypothetical protein [Xanthobacteraceae bacterium]
MAKAPKSVTIRTYQVGFGDCFLLSFDYGSSSEKHVLIDYGSTGFPKGVPKTRMMDIAQDIKKRTGGKLHAVVATHRHRDHISGFATAKGGKGTGDVIASLKPDVVVQPWTEDPDLSTTATGPGDKGAAKTKAKAKKAKKSKKSLVAPGKLKMFGAATPNHIAALALMNEFALRSLSARNLPRAMAGEIRFLGESNLANASAVKNLMNMAKNSYVFTGAKSGLEMVLPGVKIDVLGPPTVKQTDTIKKQRARDPDEFWHFALASLEAANRGTPGREGILFPRHVKASGHRFPVNARWLVYHVRTMRAEQLLQIVRNLDKQMNNTSVILLMQIGKTKLLFPGDAQLENWQFALGQKKYVDLLKSVNLYKVGHHGSLNATPKSLWKLFENKSSKKTAKRLLSLMSTMEGKHGSTHSHTEVPRETLVHALEENSEFFTTQALKGKVFFHDTTMQF